MRWWVVTASEPADTGPVDTRPRGREEIVAAALDAAERLFAEAGPDAVSLRSIADEAGVTYSLVNRHLGTKRDIVDALLARTERRWRERSAGADFRGAVAALLGDSAETGAYLRLLAWSLLAGGHVLAAHRDHARLHELVPLADRAVSEHEWSADERVAIALSLVLGWRFFNPFIVGALHLDERDAARLHAAVGEFLSTEIS